MDDFARLSRWASRIGAFYQMIMEGTVDNPDHAISEDIASFTENALLYLTIFIRRSFLQLYSRHLVVGLTLARKSRYSLTAGLGTWLSVAVGRRLVKINFDQQRYEADFPLGLVHVRDNVEPIYMYGGQAGKLAIASSFQRAVRQLQSSYTLAAALAFVTTPYGLLIQLLSDLPAGELIFPREDSSTARSYNRQSRRLFAKRAFG